MIEIDQLDHLVLAVAHIEASCRFYSKVLGMQVTTFAGQRKALQFGKQKINLHQHGREYEPKALLPTPGSADICLVCRASMADVIAHLESCEVPVIDGPVRRSGARGPLLSV
jgi:catechol 2,3-dioxygenase-like lactoylglutathione lyase family enzyme